MYSRIPVNPESQRIEASWATDCGSSVGHKVFFFNSVSGGCGTTSCALAVAGELAGVFGKRVVLIETSQAGDLSSMFDDLFPLPDEITDGKSRWELSLDSQVMFQNKGKNPSQMSRTAVNLFKKFEQRGSPLLDFPTIFSEIVNDIDYDGVTNAIKNNEVRIGQRVKIGKEGMILFISSSFAADDLDKLAMNSTGFYPQQTTELFLVRLVKFFANSEDYDIILVDGGKAFGISAAMLAYHCENIITTVDPLNAPGMDFLAVAYDKLFSGANQFPYCKAYGLNQNRNSCLVYLPTFDGEQEEEEEDITVVSDAAAANARVTKLIPSGVKRKRSDLNQVEEQDRSCSSSSSYFSLSSSESFLSSGLFSSLKWQSPLTLQEKRATVNFLEAAEKLVKKNLVRNLPDGVIKIKKADSISQHPGCPFPHNLVVSPSAGYGQTPYSLLVDYILSKA